MRKVLMLAVAVLGFTTLSTAQQAPVKVVKTSKSGHIKANAKRTHRHKAMVLKPAPEAAK